MKKFFTNLLFSSVAASGGPSNVERLPGLPEGLVAPAATKEKVRKCAVVIFNDCHGHVLLQKRINTSMMNNQYAFIGGGIEEGENPERAAIREVQEEIGVHLEPQDLAMVHHMPIHFTQKRVNLDSTFFEVRNMQGLPQIKEPEKASALGWFSNNDLPREAAPYVPFLLEKLARGEKESEFTTER
jgi:mutator protein MutT